MAATNDTARRRLRRLAPGRRADAQPIDDDRQGRIVLWVVFALSTVWLAYYALNVESFAWLIDEMLWFKSAITFADGEALLIPEAHGVKYGPPNGLYPRLLSPVFWVFGTIDSFKAIHVANAAMFASVIFPVYLSVRRLGGTWRWAVTAGLLSVAVPYAVLTLIVMTESMAYPAFMWGVYAIALAAAEPRLRNDLLALVAIGLATYTRTQFVLLGGALVLAIAAREFAAAAGTPEAAGRRARLRAHAPLGVLFLLGAAVFVGGKTIGIDALGSYGGLFDTAWFPPQVWWNLVEHLSHIIVAIGILPWIFFVVWLVRLGSGPRSPFELTFAVTATAAGMLVLYQAAWFAQNIAGGQVQERYAFYIVPIIMVGFVVALADRRLPAPRVSLAAVGALTALIIGGGTFSGSDGLGTFERLSSSGRGIHQLLIERLDRIWPFGTEPQLVNALAISAAVLGVIAALALSSRHRRWLAPALAGVVVVWGITTTRWLEDKVVAAVNTTIPGQVRSPDVPGYYEGTARDWVDRAVERDRGDGEVATFAGLLRVENEGYQWNWHEFWNRTVTNSYAVVDRPSFSGFRALPMRFDPVRGALSPQITRTRYLLTPDVDPTMDVRGRVVARAQDSTVLLEPGGGDWLLNWWVSGTTWQGDTDGRKPATVYVYPDRPGDRAVRRPVTLRIETVDQGPAEVPFTIRSGDVTRRGTVRTGEPTEITVDAAPDATGRRGALRITPGTAEKAEDGRQLALRVGVLSAQPR